MSVGPTAPRAEGAIRNAAIARVTRGMSTEERIKNQTIGPHPGYTPTPQEVARSRAEFAEQRKDQAEAKAKQNYKGGSRPKPIPGSKPNPPSRYEPAPYGSNRNYPTTT